MFYVRSVFDVLCSVRSVCLLDADLTLLPYKESKDVFILGGVDNIIVQLEDSPRMRYIASSCQKWFP